MKKISIVIPVYNEEFFISGLLESISQIHYPPEAFEVIVVSDGSTDGTVSAVKKYPSVNHFLKNIFRNRADYCDKLAFYRTQLVYGCRAVDLRPRFLL